MVVNERGAFSLILLNKHKRFKESAMFNIYLSLEQKNREQQGIEARDNEANYQTELNSAGEYDGVIGLEPDPQKWRELAYRSGFLTGIGRHYDQKYQIGLDNPHSRASEPF